jgi:hypothetical protein
MKRIFIGICFVLLVAGNVFAVESIVFSIAGGSQNQMLIKAVCTSAADGTFVSLTKVNVSQQYWNKDFYLAHAYAVNGASSQPDTAGTVTITDEGGMQLVGATAGDTLTLSTSASAVAYLSIDRGKGQRPVTSPLYLTIGDTQSGAATSVFTLYLLLSK